MGVCVWKNTASLILGNMIGYPRCAFLDTNVYQAKQKHVISLLNLLAFFAQIPDFALRMASLQLDLEAEGLLAPWDSCLSVPLSTCWTECSEFIYPSLLWDATTHETWCVCIWLNLGKLARRCAWRGSPISERYYHAVTWIRVLEAVKTLFVQEWSCRHFREEAGTAD